MRRPLRLSASIAYPLELAAMVCYTECRKRSSFFPFGYRASHALLTHEADTLLAVRFHRRGLDA